jgi:hypothetical protein
MAIQIKKAAKQQKKLRLAFDGPSGSGKTMSSLRVARGLVGPEGRIIVIDTERSSASLYADDIAGGYDVAELADDFRPRNYVDALEQVVAAGADVVVIDSLSHAWDGAGGALELVDRKQAQGRGGNSFTAWRDVTPEHQALVNAILQCPVHVIVTMRSKTEYILEEDERGKKVPRKVGMAPIQRQGIDYEFDAVLDIDQASHKAIPSKTRARFLDGQVIPLVTEKLGEQFRVWLEGAAVAPPPPPPAAPAAQMPAAPAEVVTPSPTTTQAPPVQSETTAPPQPVAQPLAPQLAGQIKTAKTVDGLMVVAKVISAAVKAGKVSDGEKSQLLALYQARRNDLIARAA